MGIISKLKSVLGVADGRSSRPVDEGAPVVGDGEPGAAGERAVKGGHARERPPDEDEVPTEDVPAEEAAGASGEPVEAIKGIGPAYAERLEAAGVGSVADLAAADPDDLAAATDLGAGRVGNWIDRAKARTGTRDR